VGPYYVAFFADALLRRILTYSIVLYGVDVLGRGTWSGVLYVCLVAPYLLSIAAGRIIETTNVTSMLRLTATLILVLVAGLTGFASASIHVPMILAAIMLCYGIVSAFAYPGFLAGVADIVEPKRVGRATITMNILSLVTQVLAPVVVGVLRAFVSWPTFFICATAIAAVVCVAMFLVRPSRPAETEWGYSRQRGYVDEPVYSQQMQRPSRAVALMPRSSIAEMRAFKAVNPILPTLLIAVTLFSALAIGPLEVLVPLFTSKTLSLSSAMAGAFLATGGVGLVVGAVSALKLTGKGRTGLFLCGAAVAGSLVVLAMTISPVPVAFAMYFLGGMCAGLFSSLSLGAIQEAVTPEMRGRTVGVFTLVLGAPPAITGAAAGALSDRVGTAAALRILCVVLGVGFVLLYAMRPMLRGAPAAKLPSDGKRRPA
jgi:MFS family permease